MKGTKETKEEIMNINLNDQTVGNLKKYLDSFPDNTRVVIYDLDENNYYQVYDCQIACNFKQQHESNMILLLKGKKLIGI